MIFFSLGLPSRFGEWCDFVTARLVEQALGPVALFGADTLDQFAQTVMQTGSPHITICSRQITGRLRAALAQANRGFVVALDDPRLALERLVVRHGIDFLEATRVVAKSCASMVSCGQLQAALVLRADEAKANPVAAASAIAHHIEVSVSEADVTNIVNGLADLGIWPHQQEDKSWWDVLEEPQRALVTGAVDPYASYFAGGDLGPIIWERELFYINEEQPAAVCLPALRPVDITGRPRVVVHGPYITLPPGSWSAAVALGFSHEASEMSYIADVYTNTQLTQVRIQPGTQRQVEVDLHFSIDEPLDHAIAVRVSNERAAFDGRLAIGHVTIAPHASMRPETRSYFAKVLNE